MYIDSVSNGFSCGCRCPRCNSELQAKNGGNERAHHFAHRDGADCVGAVESAIHCLAKEILAETLCVMLPDNAGELRFDKVETERNFPDLKLRPDCVGFCNGKQFWVEFKRSHEVDSYKEGKIVSARIDCIEIDLNGCEQDKEQLREFITQSSEKRKWIYSSQYGIGQLDRSSDRQLNQSSGNEIDVEKIKRHFAIDDNGKLIDFRVPSEFDPINHLYYCPNCGKEVVLKSDDDGYYSFGHIDEAISCDDEMYLRSSAVAATQHAFIESEKFIIEVPQYRYCQQGDKCPCFLDCKVQSKQQYDLKKLHFLKCEKDYKFNDVLYRTDLVFYRESIDENAIEVRFNTETFEFDQETERRLIEIVVCNENDVCKLEKGLLGYSKVFFSGFSLEARQKAEPKEINHEVLKYTIYSSGKIHIEPVPCSVVYPILRKPNVLKEGLFIKTRGYYEDMYVFLLLYFKELWGELCRCRLCFYLRKNRWNGDYICSRFEKVNTPRNPLDENNPPKACPYFGMNFNIQNQEAALNKENEIVELF